jgi:transcriptional regulator with XRE-family HTH domain
MSKCKTVDRDPEDGMTQLEVARALGLSRPYVAKIERRALQKVAAALGEELATQLQGRTKCR